MALKFKCVLSLSNSEIEEFAGGSYPLLHESVLPLLEDFASWKVADATGEEEKSVYHRDFGILELVQRLIAKRPLKFTNSCDSYLLRNGSRVGLTIGSHFDKHQFGC